MARITLTDGTGRWFDSDKAESFAEATTWNGNNHISKATGSQWNHSKLYITASNKCILESWSDYQGTVGTTEEIKREAAAIWLSINEYEHELLSKEIAELEIK